MIRCIGRGSYGEVWLGRSAAGAWRAIKIVYRENFSDAKPYEREFTGIQSYEPLSRTNEGLIDVLQIGRNDAEGYFYYVMELADAVSPPDEYALDGEGANNDSSNGSLARNTGNFDPSSYIPKTLSQEIYRRGRLSYEECLTLGLTLNLALGHLHRHGLIHRDIKPSNIVFVNGVPKLTDIGLVTDVASAQSFVGTEGFIPPEGPNSPQSDLYALGKVLYEASMGKDRTRFPEPLTELGFHSDSQRLMELNAVLLKACAPEPKERYRRAEEMTADLALLHNGESVRDKRALARRVRVLTRIGLITVLVLVLAVIPYSVSIHEAHAAKASAERAQVEATKSAAVASFLKDMLIAVRPSVAMGRDTKLLREILDSTTRQLESQTNPEVESELREVMGQVYYELGDYITSERMLSRAALLYHGGVREQTRARRVAMSELSVAISAQGRWAEAEALQRQVLAERRTDGHIDDLEVAESYQVLGTIILSANRLSEAEVMYRKALQIRQQKLPHNDWRTAESLKGLASALADRGQWPAAESLFRETMQIESELGGEHHIAYLWTLNGLVMSLLTQHKFEEAETAANQALALESDVLSPDHPLIAMTLNRLARVLMDQNEMEPARKHLERALSIGVKRLNQDPGMADTVSALFDILFAEQDYTEAEGVFRQVAATASLNKPNKGLVSVCGQYLARTGRWKEAAEYFTKLIELDPGNHQAYQGLAAVYIQMEDVRAYEELRNKMLSLFGSVTNDPTIADRIAKSCLIIAPKNETLTKVAALADVSVSYDLQSKGEPWFQFCKGFAELRLGHFPDSKTWMTRVAEHEQDGSVRDVEAHMVLAMAEYGLGNTQAALKTYNEGSRLASRRLRDVASGDIESGWVDWIFAHALMKEAAQVLFPPSGTP